MRATLQWMLVALVVVALLAGCGPDESGREPPAPESADADLTSDQGTAVKTRTASCRCGKLSATYKGPDPRRITLCHCNSCQRRTGTVFSVQARFPREAVEIKGESTTWTFPGDAEPVTYRSCDSGGATYHFCPVCGSTVYWDIAAAPEFIGIAIGTLADPAFPAPKISGFEAYGHPWAMEPAKLPILRLEYAEMPK